MEQKRNNSRKRQAILDLLRGTASHPSAEQIYNALKNEIPELSLGTVYRNLQILEQEGLVKAVSGVEGQARYDAKLTPHIHCYCRRCRKIMDADDLPAQDIFSALRFENGFEPESFELTVSGLCPECRNERLFP